MPACRNEQLTLVTRDLDQMCAPNLGCSYDRAPAHVATLRAAGTMTTNLARTFLAQPGEPADHFTYVESGEIEVVNPYTSERHLPSTLGPTRFMGELSFLNGGAWSMAMRAAKDTRVIEVPRETMLILMAQIPEIPNIVITMFAARRRRQLEDRDNTFRLIEEDDDSNIRRIAEFASRNRIPYTSLVLGNAEAEDTAQSSSIARSGPAVIFGRDMVVTDPTPRQDCATARAQSRSETGRSVRRADRGRRPDRRVRRHGAIERACNRRRGNRRTGQDIQPDRELHELFHRHLGRPPRIAKLHSNRTKHSSNRIPGPEGSVRAREPRSKAGIVEGRTSGLVRSGLGA